MKKNDWCVMVSWEEDGQSFEEIVKSGLTEVEALDYMIHMEKLYEGTGNTFCCLKREKEMK